ncbi:MAG: hypothetical protein Q4G50_09725 [Corynebacterium sp.]|uniref:hypothetical protein n=1 Tax=Corynebacterium sp. TaxID=1720 RepID=UPI0026DF1135|nr:hypothetical protein [Corynebacterium sp.]MDO5670271.1 hypothetical protein [Corynebacterium sp.]
MAGTMFRRLRGFAAGVAAIPTASRTCSSVPRQMGETITALQVATEQCATPWSRTAPSPPSG